MISCVNLLDYSTMLHVSAIILPLSGYVTHYDKLQVACARVPDDDKLNAETCVRD
jgi:hypothetical protein